MLDFTNEQIIQTREYLQKQGYREVQSDLPDLSFSYFVVPQSANPELPDYVMRMTGPGDEKLFGISDSVPEEFRPYAVAHEVIEFTDICPKTTENACIVALERELALVPKGMESEYVLVRARFFDNLVGYVQKNADFYTQRDVAQFAANRDTLNRHLKNI